MTELLTVAQVAERLQIHPATVRNYLRAGIIRGRALNPNARRNGIRWRVPEAALANYEARTQL